MYKRQDVVSPTSSSPDAAKAWHFLLPGYDSGNAYYGLALDLEIKATLAANRAISYAQNVINAHPNVDTTKPSVLVPQRYPSVSYTHLDVYKRQVYDKIVDKGAEAGGLKSKIFFWALSLIENYDPKKPKSLKHKIADKIVFKKWREGLGCLLYTSRCV